jgi:hypothetical protein
MSEPINNKADLQEPLEDRVFDHTETTVKVFRVDSDYVKRNQAPTMDNELFNNGIHDVRADISLISEGEPVHGLSPKQKQIVFENLFESKLLMVGFAAFSNQIREYYSNLSLKVTFPYVELDVSVDKELDLPNNMRHYLIWCFLKKKLRVANSLKEVNPGYHRYYLLDEEKDTNDDFQKRELKFESVQAASKVTAETAPIYLYIFRKEGNKLMEGITNIDAMSPKAQQLKCDELADSNPKRFIQISKNIGSKEKWGDAYYEYRILRMVTYNLIDNHMGVYVYNNTRIGEKIEHVVSWFKDSTNLDHTLKLGATLDSIINKLNSRK